MDRLLAAVLAAMPVVDAAGQDAPAAAPAQPPLAARPTNDVIKDAVRETLASTPTSKHGQLDGRVLRGDSYKKFSRAFSEAEVPSCVRPDALKHQPTSVEYGGWVFGVGSIYATPFWVYAAVTGKCHMKLD
ncbi:MAG: hypothetical protein ACXWC4_14600 [Telluria sp.]